MSPSPTAVILTPDVTCAAELEGKVVDPRPPRLEVVIVFKWLLAAILARQRAPARLAG